MNLKYIFAIVVVIIAAQISLANISMAETFYKSVSADSDYVLPVESDSYTPAARYVRWGFQFVRTDEREGFTIVKTWIDGCQGYWDRDYDSRNYDPGSYHYSDNLDCDPSRIQHQIGIDKAIGSSNGHFNTLKFEVTYSADEPDSPDE